jgi:hypothetical protein
MINPSVDEVRAWVQVPATAVSDPQMQQVIDAEVALQCVACRVPRDAIVVPELTQAIYRRVGRHIAARGVPLGLMGADAEYGPTRLARWDAEIERLEGTRRVVVFG